MIKFVHVAFIAALVTVSMGAQPSYAARNNFEFSNVNFNNRFASVAASERRQEAADLISDSEDRRSEAESEARQETFASRSLLSSLLNQAEDDMFAGVPGDSGEGNLNGSVYMWEVTATERIFTLDGTEVFRVSCTGGC